jgi:hypothetical protein
LLNVTLSRAQDHLVVVADVEFLDAHVAADSEVARIARLSAAARAPPRR